MALTGNVIEGIATWVDDGSHEIMWTGEKPMFKSRDDFFHFKLEQYRQKLVSDAMYGILYGNLAIDEIKALLAKATEIIEYQESKGRLVIRKKGEMDANFGLYLMRSPEVKRWN